MSVLEIYINWVNSVLAEVGVHVDGVEALQDGKVLCELIDILVPDAGLLAKVKASGDCTALTYIKAALEHMRQHGINVRFPAEDIIQNDVKSMLDVLWIMILNYSIHDIRQNVQHRSIGVGKKNLLEWCQEELGATFDPGDTIAFNLCSNDWFIRLLDKVTHHCVHKSEDKSEYIEALLRQIQEQYLIKKDIIKALDIVDGTVDEHSLMIYLSLLKRKVQHTWQQTDPLSSDSQRSVPAVSTMEAQEAGQLDDVFNPGRRRSSTSSWKPIITETISYQVFGDGSLDRPSLGSHFSEFESSPSKQFVLSQNISNGNKPISQDINLRTVEYVSEVGTSRNPGKEMESQMVSEKETDTLSEFANFSSLTRDKPDSVISEFLEANHATHDTKNFITADQNDTLTTLSSSSYRYNTAENDSQRVSDITHRPIYSGSNQTDVEPHSQRMSVHRYWENPREENLKIRIKRPKDYLRQWEDTIDRLSTVSLTDEFGSPKSPLISSYKTSRPLRAKSLEAGLSSYRNSVGPASGSFERHNMVASRSKSSDALPTVSASSQDFQSSSIDHYRSHGGKQQTSLAEKGNTGLTYPSNRLGRIQGNMHYQLEDDSSPSMVTSRSEVPTLKVKISVARDNFQVTVPQSTITSHRGQSQGNITPHRAQSQGSSETVEQTILKKRDRSEPSSSGSRVRFQQQTNVKSHYSKHSPTEEPQMSAISTAASPILHRVQSLSPHKQTVSSNSISGSSQRDADIFSDSARLRYTFPYHTTRTVKDPETASKYIHLNVSSEDLSASAAHPPREGLLQTELGLSTREFDDEISDIIDSGNLSTGTTSIDYPTEKYILSAKKTFSSERPPMNTELKRVSGLDFEWNLDRGEVGHLIESRDISPPPISRGGAGRVPRREAWELERRKKEDFILDNQTDTVSQSRVVEALCMEIEMLKQKVEILEESGVSQSLNLLNRSPSAVDSRRQTTSFITRRNQNENNSLVDAEQMKLSFRTSNGRAISCPLLKLSRRSPATRSLSRSSTLSVTSEVTSPRNNNVTTYHGRSNNSSSTLTPRNINIDLNKNNSYQHNIEKGINKKSFVYLVKPETFGDDLTMAGSFEFNKMEHWKQLISHHTLSESEVRELKQALASALAENDILQTKLSNVRFDIHDKLKHTNGVLDDCRHHLAKAQAENMELRTVLEHEKQKSEANKNRIRNLEQSILKVNTDNQQLENELDQTAALFDHSLNTMQPEVDSLKVENSKLSSKLIFMEHKNDDLEEEVHSLKQNQDKAIATMDALRECLSKIREERQELFDKLASLQRQDQTDRVKEIITSCQEKDSDHEWKRKQDLLEETPIVYFDYPRSNSRGSSDSVSRSPSFRHSRSLDRVPHKLSQHQHGDPLQTKSWQFYKQRHSSRDYEELPEQVREIYPHRRGYSPHNRSCSPRHDGRSTSSPEHYCPSSVNKLSHGQGIPQNFKGTRRQEKKYVAGGIQYSQSNFPSSYSPDRNETSMLRSNTSNGKLAQSSQRIHYTEAYPSQYRLDRSFSSAEDVNNNPFTYKRIPKSRDRSREEHSTTWRNLSPSYVRSNDQDFFRRPPGNHRLHYQSASLERNPIYFIHRSHSPPTRMSGIAHEKASTAAKIKRRQLHAKAEAGEIATKFQMQFDNETKQKSSKSQNKSWFELQSDSDDEDTGINSSMSSRSSCEHKYARNKAPLLSDEQRRYADELIRKYTGNISYKQAV